MAPSGTRDRILDATLEVLSDGGLGGLSLEEVARRSDVSRQTVYRHFGNRDQLLSATILREEDAFIARIVDVTVGVEDLRAALAAAIREVLVAAREHPLLDRLLETEPEALLPFLTSGRGPVLPAARPVLCGVLRDRLPGRDEAGLERLADMLTRLLISYTVNPPDRDVDALAEALADLIVDGVGAD